MFYVIQYNRIKSWNNFDVRNHLNTGWCRESRLVLSLSFKINKVEKLPFGLFSPHNWYQHLVGHKLLLQRAKLFEILQGDIKAKMTQHLYNFHMSEEINTFCHTVWKQSVQGSLSGCRFGLFLLWQRFSASVSFSFQKVPAAWPCYWNCFFLPRSWGSHCH